MLWWEFSLKKPSNIHTDVAFWLCLSPILLRDIKTGDHRQPWLRRSWNMLMPWFCFHWEGSLAVAYHLISACIESLCVNCHNMCFRLLTPQQAPLLWAIIWGQRWMFILAEIPSRIHAHFLRSEYSGPASHHKPGWKQIMHTWRLEPRTNKKIWRSPQL